MSKWTNEKVNDQMNEWTHLLVALNTNVPVVSRRAMDGFHQMTWLLSSGSPSTEGRWPTSPRLAKQKPKVFDISIMSLFCTLSEITR